MSSDTLQLRNIRQYVRKTYRQPTWVDHDNIVDRDADPLRFDTTNHTIIIPDKKCSCDAEEGESRISNILHKKCAVISLAEKQLQRLYLETDRLLSDENRRSIYAYCLKLKEILEHHNLKFQFALLTLTVLGFFFGLLLGAASCGANSGRFESPILSCIDNYFIQDKYFNDESYGFITA